MTKIRVDEDIEELLQSVYDYISDAATQLDSARDKMAFLDVDHKDEGVQKFFYDTKKQLEALRLFKRRMLFIMQGIERVK
jgi:transposase